MRAVKFGRPPRFYFTSLAILIGAQLDATIEGASIETQPPAASSH